MLIGARLVQVTVVQSDIDRAYAFHGRSPFGLMSMGETSSLQEFGNLGSSGSCHLKMIWLRGSYCGSPLIEIGLIWSTTFLLASPLCVRLCAPFQHVFFIQKDQTCKFPKNGDRKFADSKLKR